MNKIIGFALIFVSFFIFNSNVKALDEYGVFISNAGVLSMRNAVTNTNISVNNNVVTYSNNVLTVKPGVHLSYIDISKEVTITSEGEQVYINYIYAPNVAVTLDNIVSSTYETTIDDSKIRYQSTYDGSKWYTAITTNGLTIKDSRITMNNKKYVSDDIVRSNFGDFYITNSYIYTPYILGSNGSTFSIKDSEIHAALVSLNTQDPENSHFIIDNSEITLVKDDNSRTYPVSGIDSYAHLNITNSKIENVDYFNASRTSVIENSSVNKDSFNDIHSYMYDFNNITLTNTTFKTRSGIVCDDLTLNDSKLYIDTFLDEHLVNMGASYLDTVSSLIIVDDFTINGTSKVKLSTTRSVPSLMLKKEPTINTENFVFADETNSYILKLENVKDDMSAFYEEDNTNHYDTYLIKNASFTDLYTLVDKDSNPVDNTESSKAVKYTFKVKNGTWDDSTEEVREEYFLEGQEPSKDLYNTVSSVDGYVLEFVKTGDNEYTYVYKELINPKTGVKSLVLLAIMSIITTFIFVAKKKKFSIFKNI